MQDRHFGQPYRICLVFREQQESWVVEVFEMAEMGSSLYWSVLKQTGCEAMYTPTKILKEEGLRWSREESSFKGVLHF